MKLRVEYSVIGDKYEVAMHVLEINGFSVFASEYRYSCSSKRQNTGKIIQYSEFSKEKDDNKIKVNQVVNFTYDQEFRFTEDTFEIIIIECNKNSIDEIMGLLAKVTEIKEEIEVGIKQYEKCNEAKKSFLTNSVEMFETSKDGKLKKSE